MRIAQIKEARRFDTMGRTERFNEIVYSGEYGSAEQAVADIEKLSPMNERPISLYNLYVGELHGHSNFSDGKPSIDEYFTNLRDTAKLDFAALTDHDHGGVGKRPDR